MKFEYKDRRNKITNEDIIKDVLRVKNDILKSKTITFREYRQYSKYGKKAIGNHFGGWNNLLEILGIPKTKEITHLGKEDIFNIIKDIWLKLGDQPTIRNFTEMTHHTIKIIKTNFGTWSNCLQKFVEWANNNEINFKSSTPTIKHSTPRDPGNSLRYKVLSRDNFRCVICGQGQNPHLGITLEVDHIAPYSKGGETTLDNLQTLCNKCNSGKSNKIG